MYWRALLAGTTWIESKCFVELGPDKNMHKNVKMCLENWCIQLLYHLREKKEQNVLSNYLVIYIYIDSHTWS